MARTLCIVQDFLSDEHRTQIRNAADKTGFAPEFFTTAELDAAKSSLATCEALYAGIPEAFAATGASLRWYACSNAGVEAYCKEPSPFANPDCILTCSNVYGVSVAEHVVMVTLELLRGMPSVRDALRRHEWADAPSMRSIKGGAFTILGTGNLGQTIAARFRSMEARRLLGLNRTGRKVQLFDEILPISQLDAALPKTTFLILALPSTPETVHILDSRRIAMLPAGAYVVNVGRGDAVDQDALRDALNNGSLAGAALDVTVPEPLPAEHPLWDAQNLILTPHIAGKMSLAYTRDENVKLFCKNLFRYAAGQPMMGVVDRARGY